MEEKYTVIGVAIGVIFLTWVWKVLNWVWFKPRKLERCLRQQGLKGNSYRFLVGDLKDSSKMRKEVANKPTHPFTNDYFSRVLPFEHQHAHKFGKNSFTWMGPIPWVNITDPELIRDVFARMNEFQRPKLIPLLELLTPGLVSHEGQQWVKHRKLINPAFHVEKLKLMLPAFRTCVIETIKKWEKMVSETGSSEMDVLPHFTNLTGDVISKAAFGSSFEEGRMIFELLNEQKELIVGLTQSPLIFIPGWKYVPTKSNRRMKETNVEIQALLKGIIDNRKKAMEAGEATGNDLLGILMESNFNEAKIYGSGMSFEDMIDECKLFFLAGQETTSVLLAWAMVLLGKHQDWQTRARDEVLATFGDNQPDFDGLSRLKTVTMILYEVLRLYPPIITTSRKIYDHEEKLGNLSLPHGVVVNLMMFRTHQDPKLWGDDAKEFNPERFSEGISKATNGNVSFFPFGWGPRICIGQNFAIVEAKMALAMILQHFSFELSPSYTHAPTRVLALQPQYGAQVIMRRRV